MGTTIYGGNTAYGKLIAESMDDIVAARDKLNYVQGLLVQVGNMTDPFDSANLESGSGLLTVDAGKGQELFDKVGNIKSAFDTFWSGQGETVLSLSQGG